MNHIKNSRFVMAKGDAGADVVSCGGDSSLLLWVGAEARAPQPTGGACLLCALDEQGAMHCQYHDGRGGSAALSATQEPGGYRLLLSPWSLELFVGVAPWYESIALAARCTGRAPHFIYLPFCGWLVDGGWYDGPLFHQLTGDATHASMIPLGGPFRLIVGASAAQPSPRQIHDESLAAAPMVCAVEGRGSLVAALRYHLGTIDESSGIALDIQNYDLIDAVGLVLCRMAFPSSYLCLYDRSIPTMQQRYWRRLCQNLAIDFGASHKKLLPPRKITGALFHQLFDQATIKTAIPQTDLLHTVIPECLWHT